jgi:lipoprotein Spr
MKMCIKYSLVSLVLIYFTACKQHQTLSTEKTESKKETTSSSLKKKYAEKLGVSESAITNQKLYQFINEWYGVPYKYAGKDKGGIDCSGLASTLYNSVYQKKISPTTKILVDEVKTISISNLKEGDLVFFNIDSKNASHVGVYLQNNKFIHASSKKGVMISDLNEPYFKKYFMSAGRVK